MFPWWSTQQSHSVHWPAVSFWNLSLSFMPLCRPQRWPQELRSQVVRLSVPVLWTDNSGTPRGHFSIFGTKSTRSRGWTNYNSVVRGSCGTLWLSLQQALLRTLSDTINITFTTFIILCCDVWFYFMKEQWLTLTSQPLLIITLLSFHLSTSGERRVEEATLT